MKLGMIRKNDSASREMWKALSHVQRAVAVSLGLYKLDDDGLPVLDGEMMVSALKDIEEAERVQP